MTMKKKTQNRKKFFKRRPHIAIATIITVVIVLLTVVYFISIPKRTLVGAARLQIQQAQPQIPQKEAPPITAIEELKPNLKVPKTFICPEMLYPKTEYEIPDGFVPFYDPDGYSVKTKPIPRSYWLCEDSGMKCYYGYGEQPPIKTPPNLATDCKFVEGIAGCTCLTK